MRRKIFIILALTIILIFPNNLALYGAIGPNPVDMAVYLNQDFDGNSAIIDGSLYSANGNIIFSNAGDNQLTGSAYYQEGKNFIFPGHTELGQPLTATAFNADYPDLLDFPEISNVMEHIGNWNTAPLIISEDTHFTELNVCSNQAEGVIIDTSSGDIYLVVDKLGFNWGKSIKVEGNGRLFLFIHNFTTGQGPLIINNGQNPDQTYIFSRSTLQLGTHKDNNILHAHVFYSGIQDLKINGEYTFGEGSLKGSLFTDATSFLMEGGGRAIEGLVFAPFAHATIMRPGKYEGSNVHRPNITGRLVAKSLDLSNSGTIKYDPPYANPNNILIPEILKPVKHSVTITVQPSAGGIVSPSSAQVDNGGTIQITATPNEGYKFTGFTAGGATLADENGIATITVNGPMDITANFTKEDSSGTPIEVPEGFVHGLLGEYYDTAEPYNQSALKMKRLDSQIAFNFGYDETPHPSIERENFSVRWSGYIQPPVSGNYTFKAFSDDGVKVRINGQGLINSWGPLSLNYSIAQQTIALEAGELYPITVEYQQLPLFAAVFLFWEAENLPMGIVPPTAFLIEADNYFSGEKMYNTLEKSGTGLNNRFYASDDFNASPIFTETNSVDYTGGASDWGLEGLISNEKFYAVMEGYLEAKYTEETTLIFIIDDGLRVWLNDEQILNEWDWHNQEVFKYNFPTIAGEKYRLKIEYANFGLGATCIMGWESPAIGKPETIPIEFLYPAN